MIWRRKSAGDPEPRQPGRAGDTDEYAVLSPRVLPSPPGRGGDTEALPSPPGYHGGPSEVTLPPDMPDQPEDDEPEPETEPGIELEPQRPRVVERAGQGIALAALIIASGNVLSRLLGLVREQVAANMFGVGDQIAAFTIADNIHTMLFDLVISGMMQAALIPVLSQYTGEEQRDELRRITGALLTLAVLVVGGIVGVLMIFAPSAVQVMTALGGGEEARGPDTFALTVEIVRIILPAVLLLAVSTILMSTLFALQRFTLPSLSLSLRNVAIVVAALTLGRTAFGVKSLALGIVLGALLLIVVQLPGLRDVMPRPNVHFRHPAIRRIGLLYLPIFIGLFANTIALIVDRNLAWGTSEEALGAMRYATTLNQMVLGLVAAAISLASLPALSRYWAAGDEASYWATLARGLRMVTVLVVPATFGLAVLSWPTVQLVFQHGATDRDSAIQILIALLVYLPGTLFAAFDQVLIFAYYARQNTKTPQIVGVIAVGVYFIFALTLVQPFGMAGLVAANSAQFIFHTIVMIVLIRRLLPAGLDGTRMLDGGRVMRTIRVCAIASFGMAWVAGGVAYGLHLSLPDWSSGFGSTLREVIVLLIPVGIGGAIYAGGLLLFRVEEMDLIVRKLRAALAR
ncbi:MAG TPA: murein biosynthesis integral membrane protein MurJ [Thermomicrobiales bacterium]|nr:murein biosynthesis integral membrane protein MurJ [Thermomicrobiales bacterium]